MYIIRINDCYTLSLLLSYDENILALVFEVTKTQDHFCYTVICASYLDNGLAPRPHRTWRGELLYGMGDVARVGPAPLVVLGSRVNSV